MVGLYGALDGVSPQNIVDGDIIVLQKVSNGGQVWCGGGQFNIIEYHPKPFKDGDDVLDKCSGYRGRIIHVHGDMAWVSTSSSTVPEVIRPLAFLEHIR